MIKWLKDLSVKQSRKNISEVLDLLIGAANRADGSIKERGQASHDELQEVKKLRDQLYFEFAGPIPLEQVWAEFLEPALDAPDISDGAILAVTSIYQFAEERLG